MLIEEVGPNGQAILDGMVGRNHSLMIEVRSVKLYLKHLVLLDRSLESQMNQALELDRLIQQTNHKDYLKLEQVKNVVLYLNCEVMQKGPKKRSLYL